MSYRLIDENTAHHDVSLMARAGCVTAGLLRLAQSWPVEAGD
jgi:hypothetical protein